MCVCVYTFKCVPSRGYVKRIGSLSSEQCHSTASINNFMSVNILTYIYIYINIYIYIYIYLFIYADDIHIYT